MDQTLIILPHKAICIRSIIKCPEELLNDGEANYVKNIYSEHMNTGLVFEWLILARTTGISSTRMVNFA